MTKTDTINSEIILPLGTIIIIKEPFIYSDDSGNFWIEINSPTDIIILSNDIEQSRKQQRDRTEF